MTIGTENERTRKIACLRLALLCGALMLAILGVFWPTLGNDFVNYDDPRYILDNPHVRTGLNPANIAWAFGSHYAGNWHPLTWLSHMLDCQLFGLKAWGHHLVGIILHSVNSIFVFLIFRRMTGATWRSLFVAAMFGLHPLHVESVAWAAERKDVLSTLFWLLTMWAYARFVEEVKLEFVNRGGELAEQQSKGNIRPLFFPSRSAAKHYLLALIVFALGLMSKPMLVTLPFVLLLLDYWPFQRLASLSHAETAASIRRLVAEKLPFFLLALAASAITFVVQRNAGAMDAMEKLPFAPRLANCVISYWRYLGKFVAPFDLAVFYPFPNHWAVTAVIPAAALLLAISALTLAWGRKHPYLPVGWFWFLGTMVPVIGLVQVGGQALADRYMYVPMLGILVLCAWGASDLARNWKHGRIAILATAAASLIICASLTAAQIRHWHDSDSLFRHALAVTKDNAVAHLNLGVCLAQNGRAPEAIAEFRLALKDAPDDARGHLNLAGLLSASGQAGEAIAQYRAALQLRNDLPEPHLQLAQLLAGRGDLDGAASHLRQSLAIEAEPDARILLASILRHQGRLNEAIEQYQMVLESTPDHFDAHNNLAIALYQKGLLADAVVHFRDAVRLKPRLADAHANLALALADSGATDAAIAECRQALELDPGSLVARRNLDTLLGNQPPHGPP